MNGPDATTALLVVDMQNDFCPGGALGVAGADQLRPRSPPPRSEPAQWSRPATGIRPITARSPPRRPLAGALRRRHRRRASCTRRSPGCTSTASRTRAPTATARPTRGSTAPIWPPTCAAAVWSGCWSPASPRTTACGQRRSMPIREGFQTTVLTDAVAPVERAPRRRRQALAEVAAAAAGSTGSRCCATRRRSSPSSSARPGGCARWWTAAGRGKAVIGLSGGIDSAVAAALAARALGPEHVVAVRLPSRHTEQVHIDDAALAAAAGLPEANLLTIRIDPVLKALESMRPTLPESAIR